MFNIVSGDWADKILYCLTVKARLLEVENTGFH